MNDYTLREISGFPEMLAQHHLIEQLNPDMPKERYHELLRLMLPYNYRMVGAFDASEKCVGLSGFWIAAKFYSGKYLEIDNFVVDAAYRAKGIGKLLTDWLLQLAKHEGCDTVMLDAYVTNTAAHRFYLREGFQIKGFHFLKSVHT
ncbi:GNAT family N-acetyltransferase [Pontibacter oryzae]|uniref:GNAT family N-acetyltransferase n=1 Tax=Pontibacter oryzae TaxID=2304593 RepID=A0A399S483_9BACT|nr:GNAT family N-acetyltransferase [Pontibacter oryzae]RIJ37564.1 GNAT family N-acetyltransferase [Pontibacter oryzae]